jgi:diguanylate cyclase (GGDEF)-like protein
VFNQMQCPKTKYLGLLCASMICFLKLSASPTFAQTSNEIGLTSAELDYLAQKKVLRVCVDPDRLPFDGVDEDGKHDGLSKDVFEIFSRMLNVKMVVPKVDDWNDLMAKAKNRDCDVVSQINANDERRAFLDFTTPYFYLPLAVVTRYDRIFVEEGLQGSGLTFAVIKDDIAIEKLKNRYPKINLVEVKNNIVAMKMVYDEKVFGYIGAQGAVAFAIQALDLDKLAVTGSLPLRYDLSVASRNDEPLLGSALEKAVLAIDPKEAQSIRDKWIAIAIEKVVDYTLVWEIMAAGFVLLLITIYWNRKLSALNKELNRLSITDKLTGLFNRVKIDDMLDGEIHRAKRFGQTFGLILLDIDHYKMVNDTHGHQVGDQVLIDIAQILRTNIRQTDVVGRWGGEEFIIVCPQSDESGTFNLAENLRTKLASHHFQVVGHKTASFGVSTYRTDDTSKDIVGRADAALYHAKQLGRNQVVTFKDKS